MQRDNLQPTFTDLTVADLGGPRATAFFDRCLAEIPFDQLAESVKDVFADDDPAGGTAAGTPAGRAAGGVSLGGAPHWPVVTMVKVVFLQKCFGLSDPAAEEMLRDRISFRRFVGLSFDDKTPDHSTISTFRKRLRDKGHGSTLFDKTLEILRSKGLVRNAGTLIDATILEAPPGGRRADGSGTADPLASKAVKGGRTYHGFRAHAATDRRGVVIDYVYDTARVSEHAHFDHLARDETRAVIADGGCRSKDRVDKLRKRGVVAGLCHRRVKGQKELTPSQKRFNRLIAPIRAFVEHPFAWIKTRLNNRRVRYRGLARNALDFALSAVAYNFCRSLTLKPVAPAVATT